MIPLVRFFLGFTLVLTSLFLILLVLVQRGRGGGLAGALGGMGGQSAFGTKAGDVFTRITVGVAAFWILLCILSINVLGKQRTLFSSNLGGAAPQAVAPSETNSSADKALPANTPVDTSDTQQEIPGAPESTAPATDSLPTTAPVSPPVVTDPVEPPPLDPAPAP